MTKLGHFGFVQVPNIPAALRQAKDRGCPIDLEDAIYFGSRDAVICSKRRSWPVRAGLRLFTLMFRNSVRAVDWSTFVRRISRKSAGRSRFSTPESSIRI